MSHIKNKISFCFIIGLIAILNLGIANAQADSVVVSGVILDSGTGNALEMASVSVAETGVSTSTDEAGKFSIVVPHTEAQILVNLPGYTKRNIYLHGASDLKIVLVPEQFRSNEDEVVTPIDVRKVKQLNFATGVISSTDLEMTTVSSFDQALQGKISGLSVTNKTATPGQRTFMNIRGISSVLADNEPLMYIDGMIHNYTNVGPSIMEGFATNPLDVLDVDDIQDVTVLKDGVSYLGSVASGGVININTEQESETSTRIKFSTYGGIALTPKQQDVLGADEFPSYFNQVLASQGLSNTMINQMYPWLNGSAGDIDYYNYHNNTDWQDIVLKPGILQKYHFFLKGGDEIATYNISTGYTDHQGIYDNSSFNRFNLRVNGKINISNRFSIQPNVKLSYGNTNVHNQGYSTFKNPLTSALLKPSIMATHGRDNVTGDKLPATQDVGAFGISNPYNVVNEAIGSNVNYNFLSSVKANFAVNDKLNISTLMGLDYSNTHEDLFLPDHGLAAIDTLKENSPGYFVNEFQSIQNHTKVTYTNSLASGHNYIASGGFRFMANKYKYSTAIDYNTASDEINTIGSGGGSYSYLRQLLGNQSGSVWVSYFAGINYNYRNKLYLETNISYDGSSALDGDQRYNIFPSIAAGYQVLPDLKLRGSYSLTGNMFSSVYNYADLYYVGRMFNDQGVIVRESLPNPDMEIEKTSTFNLGADLSLLRERVNLSVDVYQSDVANLLMNQSLDGQWGFVNYVNNGGHLQSRGVELALNTRFNLGEVLWTVNATAAFQKSEITELDFISDGVDQVVSNFTGGAMVTKVGEAPNVFYGYKTDGVYQTDAEANLVNGPNGPIMYAGDVKYVDKVADNIINSDDMEVIGDPNPDVFGGVYTTFRYKKLQVSAQINYSIGNDAFNYVRYLTESMSDYSNQLSAVNGSWSGVNTSNDMPRVVYGDPSGNSVFSDRWIEDASFVRLKDLTVSYDMPNIVGARAWTVYATATNLLTFTKYSGFDPEFMYDNNIYTRGVDYGQMPQSRKFIVGIKLDL